MFIPAFFVFSNGLHLPENKLKNRNPLLSALSVFALLCIIPGARSGFVAGKNGMIDSIVPSVFHISNRLNGTATGWLVSLLILAMTFHLLMNIKRANLKIREIYMLNTCFQPKIPLPCYLIIVCLS